MDHLFIGLVCAPRCCTRSGMPSSMSAKTGSSSSARCRCRISYSARPAPRCCRAGARRVAVYRRVGRARGRVLLHAGARVSQRRIRADLPDRTRDFSAARVDTRARDPMSGRRRSASRASHSCRSASCRRTAAWLPVLRRGRAVCAAHGRVHRRVFDLRRHRLARIRQRARLHRGCTCSVPQFVLVRGAWRPARVLGSRTALTQGAIAGTISLAAYGIVILAYRYLPVGTVSALRETSRSSRSRSAGS